LSEYDFWKHENERTLEWVALGKALRRHLGRDDTLVYGSVGAVGYYSGLFIYDTFGLVNREVGHREVDAEELKEQPRPPGHHKGVRRTFFAKYAPDHLWAGLSEGRVRRVQGFPNYWMESDPIDADLVYGENKYLRRLSRRGITNSPGR
jgi:hypothetical protein